MRDMVLILILLFMATGNEIIARLKGINVQVEAIETFNKHAETAAQLNRVQLSHGMKGDGTFLPDYSYTSVTKFGKPPGPIKLYDTGAFYMDIEYKAIGVQIVSDSKSDKRETIDGSLPERYGPEILTLLDESKGAMITKLVRPTYIGRIREQTGFK